MDPGHEYFDKIFSLIFFRFFAFFMLKVEPFSDKNVFDNLVFNSLDLSF